MKAVFASLYAAVRAEALGEHPLQFGVGAGRVGMRTQVVAEGQVVGQLRAVRGTDVEVMGWRAGRAW